MAISPKPKTSQEVPGYWEPRFYLRGSPSSQKIIRMSKDINSVGRIIQFLLKFHIFLTLSKLACLFTDIFCKR